MGIDTPVERNTPFAWQEMVPSRKSFFQRLRNSHLEDNTIRAQLGAAPLKPRIKVSKIIKAKTIRAQLGAAPLKLGYRLALKHCGWRVVTRPTLQLRACG